MTKIKVDLDGRLPDGLDERIHWCLSMLKWRAAWWSLYRTRNGWHLEIAVRRRVHPWKVIALQAILGSDYRRETFNLRRTGRWRSLPAVARRHWNVLFVRKQIVRVASANL